MSKTAAPSLPQEVVSKLKIPLKELYVFGKGRKLDQAKINEIVTWFTSHDEDGQGITLEDMKNIFKEALKGHSVQQGVIDRVCRQEFEKADKDRSGRLEILEFIDVYISGIQEHVEGAKKKSEAQKKKQAKKVEVPKESAKPNVSVELQKEAEVDVQLSPKKKVETVEVKHATHEPAAVVVEESVPISVEVVKVETPSLSSAPPDVNLDVTVNKGSTDFQVKDVVQVEENAPKVETVIEKGKADDNSGKKINIDIDGDKKDEDSFPINVQMESPNLASAPIPDDSLGETFAITQQDDASSNLESQPPVEIATNVQSKESNDDDLGFTITPQEDTSSNLESKPPPLSATAPPSKESKKSGPKKNCIECNSELTSKNSSKHNRKTKHPRCKPCAAKSHEKKAAEHRA